MVSQSLSTVGVARGSCLPTQQTGTKKLANFFNDTEIQELFMNSIVGYLLLQGVFRGQ